MIERLSQPAFENRWWILIEVVAHLGLCFLIRFRDELTATALNGKRA